MKKIFVILCCILPSVLAFGQDWSVSISPTLNDLNAYAPIYGGSINKAKIGFSTSLQYEFINEKRISLGMGVGYQYSQVEIFPSAGLEGDGHTESANLISASFKMVYKFKNQFYLSLDPLLDFQLHSDSPYAIENQTGLGLSFAAGKKIFRGESFYVRVEPRIWIHNIIPLNDEFKPLKLTVIGINLGVGLSK